MKRIKLYITDVVNYFKQIISPKNISCVLCNDLISRANSYSLCKKCFYKINFIQESCVKCGRYGESSSICMECKDETYHFDKIYSVTEYNSFIHKYMYKFKYGHESYLGRFFASLIEEFIKENNIEYDLITSVPISKRRQKIRGYNQSELIAKNLEGEYIELFERVKETEFLSSLTKMQRFIEIENAFKIKDESIEFLFKKAGEKILTEKIRVLIVDDILTSGSTINELSKLLKNSILNIEIIGITFCSAKK